MAMASSTTWGSPSRTERSIKAPGSPSIKSLGETDFYKKQLRVALKNCGVIDPEDINEYIAYDGYMGPGRWQPGGA